MKPLRHRLLLLGLGLSLILCAQALQAQDASTQTPPPPPPQHEMRLPPGFDKLNLTDSQKTQILQIMKDSREKMEEVLTPDQKAELQKLHAQHHWHGGPEQGQGNTPPPPPPQ